MWYALNTIAKTMGSWLPVDVVCWTGGNSTKPKQNKNVKIKINKMYVRDMPYLFSQKVVRNRSRCGIDLPRKDRKDIL